jgi:hypothetical protein
VQAGNVKDCILFDSISTKYRELANPWDQKLVQWFLGTGGSENEDSLLEDMEFILEVKNILKLDVVMAAYFCVSMENHYIVYFKMVNFTENTHQ